MVRYEDESVRKIAKRQIPQDIFVHINNALRELYEDIIDRKTISQYEKKEKEGKTSFVSSDEILKMVNNNVH
jgi:hypothetical protein